MHSMNLLICILAALWIGSGPNPPQEEHEQRDAALVSLERSGGFAGVQEKYEIYEDGRIINSRGTTIRVPAARVESILRRIAALDLPDSCRIQIPTGLCSDCFYYRITMRSRTGKIVLRFDEQQIEGRDSLSRIARNVRDLVFGQKWK